MGFNEPLDGKWQTDRIPEAKIITTKAHINILRGRGNEGNIPLRKDTDSPLS